MDETLALLTNFKTVAVAYAVTTGLLIAVPVVGYFQRSKTKKADSADRVLTQVLVGLIIFALYVVFLAAR